PVCQKVLPVARATRSSQSSYSSIIWQPIVKPEKRGARPMQLYWNTIYQTKDTTQVSWYQAYPQTSYDLIAASADEKSCHILDLGGGDSLLVDALLAQEYTNITVADIASEALYKAQTRLGTRAQQVRWIVADVLQLGGDLQVDIWHDRAAFHFLRA